MTRASYVERKRLQPVGKEGIEAIRKLREAGEARKINEVYVDTYSAGVIIAVYDVVNDTNKERLEAMNVGMLASVCMRTYAKAKK